MRTEDYRRIEGYMLRCMQDSAHDREHVYRVLYTALEIAETEAGVDFDVLIAACLLHDVGRQAQARDPGICHARAGAEMAEAFLRENGFGQEFSQKAAHCVRTHRFRGEEAPESLEAKILFDADKLDVTGAIGVARSLAYGAQFGEPLYTLTADGGIWDGCGEGPDSFLHEYKFKLEGLYGRFFTRRGGELARARREAAAAFYENLLEEARASYCGRRLIGAHLE